MGEAGCALDAMKLTLEQRLAHSGHPVLLWMMDNIYIRTDPAGNVKADKEKSTEKIDGAVATIIGLDRAIRCGNNTGASVYDDRGAYIPQTPHILPYINNIIIEPPPFGWVFFFFFL